MSEGLFLHFTERHEHVHVHQPLEHTHSHSHDEHHQHRHKPMIHRVSRTHTLMLTSAIKASTMSSAKRSLSGDGKR